MINFLFKTDNDTIRLFQIVFWCLKNFFGYTDDSAIEAINSFYEKNVERYDDDFYHHEMPFRVAVRIHYFEVLKGETDKFYHWRRESGYDVDPREAIDYFRKHYYVK
jgi:hypothetical protein